LSLADLNANFSIGASSGINTQIIAKDKLTPLFRVRQVKVSFWSGTSFSVKEKSLHSLNELPTHIEITEENVELVDSNALLFVIKTRLKVKLPPPEAVALLCSHLEGAVEVRVVSVV